MSLRRIAIVTPGFPASEADTSCTPALADFIRAFRQDAPEIDLEIFAFEFPHERRDYRWHGVRVHALGCVPAGRLARLTGYLRLWQALGAASAARGRFDAVHCFWLGPLAVLTQTFARRHGARHVVTLMGQEIRLSTRYRYLLTSRQTQAVAIGQRQADAVQQRVPGARLAVIPFGIGPFKPDQLAPPQRKYDVAFVGSLTEVKQPLLFLEVFARLPGAMRAIMVGGGPLEGQVRADLQRMGLVDRVTLTGHVAREAALQHMAQSRVLLHTAAFEGGPSVLDEALALGVAVAIRPVGKALDGPGSIIADGVEGLATAVESLLAKPAPKPRIAFSLEAMLAQYREIYGC